MNIKICDKCGRDSRKIRIPYYLAITDRATTKLYHSTAQKDLCEDCVEKLLEWFYKEC